MQNEQILDAVDPEIVTRMAARKAEIDNGSYASPGVVAALALGSVPVALAVLSREVKAQTTDVTGVLNFALALEIFENEFYKAVLGISASAAQNTAFAPVRALALQQTAAVETLKQIQKHETAHVALLLASGASNVFNLNENSFDFTGARGAGNGPFAAATTDLAFLLTVAQGAEDTGVRAYKGQAANLMSNSAVLETALRVHSVEARHASRIRRIRRLVGGAGATVRLSGTVRGGGAAAAGATGSPSAAVVAAFDKIYAGEDNVTHAGINVQTGLSGANFGVEAATEAFDEPLDRPSVVAIVQPFFIPTVS